MNHLLRRLFLPLLVVGAWPAFAQELRISALPDIGYVGKPIVVSFEPPGADEEFRVLVKSPQGNWNWDAVWSREPTLTIHPPQSGTLFVNFQARRAGSSELSINRYLGQVSVLDPAEMATLLARPFNRLSILDAHSEFSLVASEPEWRKSVSTPGELADFVRKQSAQAETPLPTVSVEGIFALNTMQVVSGLWHYGNYKNLLAPGCTNINESLSSPRTRMGFKDYLSSSIGCCTDYAVILGLTLEAAGIQSRVITTGTHVFNEAYFEGRWWTLDANIGVAYDAPWDVVVDGVSNVKAYRFPHAGTQLGSRVYSDALGDFQQYMLAVAAAGLMFDFKRYAFDDWLKQTPFASN